MCCSLLYFRDPSTWAMLSTSNSTFSSSRLTACQTGLISRGVLQAYGMFVWNAQTRTFWFNHLSVDTEQDFHLAGMILGLAIYNSVILDVHFPLVAFKKLLNKQPTFQVLAAACALASGLQAAGKP